MIRVLDFWFGVWGPELWQRYRDTYANPPEFALLPPVHKGHPDMYCLRVSVCNRHIAIKRASKEDSRSLCIWVISKVIWGFFQRVRILTHTGRQCVSISLVLLSTGTAKARCYYSEKLKWNTKSRNGRANIAMLLITQHISRLNTRLKNTKRPARGDLKRTWQLPKLPNDLKEIRDCKS